MGRGIAAWDVGGAPRPRTSFDGTTTLTRPASHSSASRPGAAPSFPTPSTFWSTRRASTASARGTRITTRGEAARAIGRPPSGSGPRWARRQRFPPRQSLRRTRGWRTAMTRWTPFPGHRTCLSRGHSRTVLSNGPRTRRTRRGRSASAEPARWSASSRRRLSTPPPRSSSHVHRTVPSLGPPTPSTRPHGADPRPPRPPRPPRRCAPHTRSRPESKLPHTASRFVGPTPPRSTPSSALLRTSISTQPRPRTPSTTANTPFLLCRRRRPMSASPTASPSSETKVAWKP